MKNDFKTKITVNFLRIYIDVFLRSQQIACIMYSKPYQPKQQEKH
jgi:hypothetical protein